MCVFFVTFIHDLHLKIFLFFGQSLVNIYMFIKKNLYINKIHLNIL